MSRSKRGWKLLAIVLYVAIGLLLFPLIRFQYELQGPSRWIPMTVLWPVQVLSWLSGHGEKK